MKIRKIKMKMKVECVIGNIISIKLKVLYLLILDFMKNIYLCAEVVYIELEILWQISID